MRARIGYGVFMALFVFILFFAMLPHGWYIRLDELGAKDQGVSLRNRLASWWGQWTTIMLWFFKRCLKVRIIYKIPQDTVTLIRVQPCVIVANHQSTLDALLYPSMCWQAGCENVRGVFKVELFKAWFFGSFFRISGAVGVKRGGDPQDIDRMREGAVRALGDQATFIIFPEGKRSVDGNLLPPKAGGLEIIVKEMNVPVVSVLTSWDVYPVGAKTMFHGASYYGRTITVSMNAPISVPEEQVRDWLTAEWDRFGKQLATKTGA